MISHRLGKGVDVEGIDIRVDQLPRSAAMGRDEEDKGARFRRTVVEPITECERGPEAVVCSCPRLASEIIAHSIASTSYGWGGSPRRLYLGPQRRMQCDAVSFP